MILIMETIHIASVDLLKSILKKELFIMTTMDVLYISILIFSLTGLYTYRKNFKSLLFLIFAIFQTYFYFNETNTTFNNVLQKISLYSSEIFSIVGILILIGILLFIFMKIIFAISNDEQKYYSYKRNNETVGDVVWGVAWRAIAYSLTGLWFWKSK